MESRVPRNLYSTDSLKSFENSSIRIKFAHLTSTLKQELLNYCQINQSNDFHQICNLNMQFDIQAFQMLSSKGLEWARTGAQERNYLVWAKDGSEPEAMLSLKDQALLL